MKQSFDQLPSSKNAAASPALKRRLNLPMITLYGLGTTIGGGIYVLVGTVAGRAGLYAPVSFFIAALMVAFTAMSFAELSSRFPQSAGEAVYVKEGLNIKALAILVGYLVAFNGIVSSAALTTGFVGYFQSMVDVPSWLAILGVIILMGALACWGIGESVAIAAIITVIEIGGLLLIIWVGRDSLIALPSTYQDLLPPLDNAVWPGIFAGSFLAFYAFIGFEDMVNVAEETQNPRRTLPIAIALTLGLTTLIYVLISVVVVSSVPIGQLATSGAPLALVYELKTGTSSEVISLIGIFAVLNGVLIQIIMASRVLYGMASLGWSFSILGIVNPVTRTPVHATLMVIGIIIVLTWLFNIEILAETTSLIMLMISVLVNLSLFQLKGKQPVTDGGFNLPRWVPLAGFVVSAVFGSFVAFSLFKNLSGLI